MVPRDSSSSPRDFHLSDGRQAVGGARGVGHHIHVRGVLLLVHSHDEHGGVPGRSADDNLSHVPIHGLGESVSLVNPSVKQAVPRKASDWLAHQVKDKEAFIQ